MIRLTTVVASTIPAMDTKFIYYSPSRLASLVSNCTNDFHARSSAITRSKGDARVVRGRHELILRLAVASFALEPERK